MPKLTDSEGRLNCVGIYLKNIGKSSHKLRKTCGSNLFKNGASAQQCSDYLGNSIEIFQRNYCFDTQTDEAMRLIVESV